jgi:hypothetical protein
VAVIIAFGFLGLFLDLTNLNLTTLNISVKRKIKGVYFCLIVTKKRVLYKCSDERDSPAGNILIPPSLPFPSYYLPIYAVEVNRENRITFILLSQQQVELL